MAYAYMYVCMIHFGLTASLCFCTQTLQGTERAVRLSLYHSPSQDPAQAVALQPAAEDRHHASEIRRELDGLECLWKFVGGARGLPSTLLVDLAGVGGATM